MSENEEILNNDFLEQIESIRKTLLEISNGESDNSENIESLLGLDFDELNAIATSPEPIQKVPLKYVSNKPLFYNYETDSGFDLYANEDVVIKPLGRALVPTGVHFDIPMGHEIQVRTKSGLAINEGLMVLNSPGTVDEGYTGEVKAIIFNTNSSEYKIKKGMKVAQAVLTRCQPGLAVDLIKVSDIKSKDRNANGFGSTGI
jgi:dUTP pyrophosphatase